MTAFTSQAARVFDALGNNVRRDILDLVGQQPKSVAQIAAAFPISRPAISRHLAQLVAAELVAFKSVGNQNFYALESKGLELTRAALDGFWDLAEKRLKLIAENTEPTAEKLSLSGTPK
jgi:DNA-binding transcriptional ArsR family regulator